MEKDMTLKKGDVVVYYKDKRYYGVVFISNEVEIGIRYLVSGYECIRHEYAIYDYTNDFNLWMRV